MLQRIFGRIGVSGVDTTEAKKPMCARKPCPGGCKVGVKLHRPLEVSGSLQQQMVRDVNAPLERYAAQIRVVSLRIACRFSCQRLLLAAGELGLQRFRDYFGDLALDGKDVS